LRIKRDERLVGATAENIFLSLVNQQGVFANAFGKLTRFPRSRFPVNDEANRRVFWIGDLRACWCMSTIANLVIERYETENRIIQQSRRRR